MNLIEKITNSTLYIFNTELLLLSFEDKNIYLKDLKNDRVYDLSKIKYNTLFFVHNKVGYFVDESCSVFSVRLDDQSIVRQFEAEIIQSQDKKNISFPTIYSMDRKQNAVELDLLSGKVSVNKEASKEEYEFIVDQNYQIGYTRVTHKVTVNKNWVSLYTLNLTPYGQIMDVKVNEGFIYAQCKEKLLKFDLETGEELGMIDSDGNRLFIHDEIIFSCPSQGNGYHVINSKGFNSSKINWLEIPSIDYVVATNWVLQNNTLWYTINDGHRRLIAIDALTGNVIENIEVDPSTENRPNNLQAPQFHENKVYVQDNGGNLYVYER